MKTRAGGLGTGSASWFLIGCFGIFAGFQVPAWPAAPPSPLPPSYGPAPGGGITGPGMNDVPFKGIQGDGQLQEGMGAGLSQPDYFPADLDKDGYYDWTEECYATDPKNPNDRPSDPADMANALSREIKTLPLPHGAVLGSKVVHGLSHPGAIQRAGRWVKQTAVKHPVATAAAGAAVVAVTVVAATSGGGGGGGGGGGDNGGSGGNTGRTGGSLSGSIQGGFSGKVAGNPATGTWQASIAPNGAVTGSWNGRTWDAYGSMNIGGALSGQVTTEGAMTAVGSSYSLQWRGRIWRAGGGLAGSGSWSSSQNGSGTWQAP